MRVDTVSLHADNGGCARDEVALVRAAQSGDVAAWSELYRVHRPRVFAVCLDHVRNRETAEELAQDVFERAWRQVGGFDGRRIGPWLRTIAANRSRDWLRHQEVEQRHLRVDRLQPATSGPEHDLLRKEGLGELEAALRHLTDRDRMLLWQRYVEDRSVPWLAAAHGLTRRSMEVALRRARSRLRQQFERGRLAVLVPLVGAWARVRQIGSRAESGAMAIWASPMVIAVAAVIVVGPGNAAVFAPTTGTFPAEGARYSPTSAASIEDGPPVLVGRDITARHDPSDPQSPPRGEPGSPAPRDGSVEASVPGTTLTVFTDPSPKPQSWRLQVTTPGLDGEDGRVYIDGHGDSTSINTMREVCKDGIEVLVLSCTADEE